MKKIILSFLLTFSTLYAGYSAPMQVSGSTTIDSKAAYDLYNMKVLFIDVRPYDMVRNQGKIQGAYNLYVDDMTQERMSKVAKKDRPMIIYCNGAGCSLTAEAVVKLVKWGYVNIYYYRDGYPAWKHYKLPVE